MGETGAIVAAIIVMVLIVLLLGWLIARPSIGTPPSLSKVHHTLKIVNESSIPQKILHDGTELLLADGESGTIALALGDTLISKGRRYDGTIRTLEKRIDSSEITTLYITPKGFRTNLSASTDTMLVNESAVSVMFVEIDSSGRRYPSKIVGPGAVASGVFSFSNSTWNVVLPVDENTPLDTLTIQGIPSKIVFTGDRLYAE